MALMFIDLDTQDPSTTRWVTTRRPAAQAGGGSKSVRKTDTVARLGGDEFADGGHRAPIRW
jgi:hypothetical protein